MPDHPEHHRLERCQEGAFGLRSLVRELRSHSRLIATCLALQAFTSMLPLVTVFKYSGRVQQSFAANVVENYSVMLMLIWTWYVAIGLVAAGGYWGSVAGRRWFLDSWRHESFYQWLHRKLSALAVLVSLVCGFVPATFLIATYLDQAALAALASLLMCLYSLNLVAAFVLFTIAGLQSGHALLAVLSFHVVNLVLDHLGLPNIITWFLIGERGRFSTALAAVAVLGSLALMLPRLANPNAMTSRGSEFV